MFTPATRLACPSSRCLAVRMTSFFGDPGAGVGKTGGSGGSIRDAGGAFGRLEAAREEEYFYKLQKAQLNGLKAQIKQEIEHHEAVLERHRRRISELEKEKLNSPFESIPLN